MDKVIDIFFPSKCVICGTYGSLVCSGCEKKIEVLDKSYCIVCDKESDGGFTHDKCLCRGIPSQMIAVFNYRGVVRDIIRKSKYYKKEFSALKFLVLYGVNLLNADLRNELKEYILVSVPPNPKNIKIRGFNQADLILREVSKKLGLKIVKNLITRKRRSASQYSYNRYDRFRAVKGVFSIKDDMKSHKSKKFLIVDDIVTSGATMLEMSKALYAHDAKDVKCLSLSKKNKDFL